ncbi:hypothetical protein Acr_22g0005250 [Actinidia rufa]|uniref:Secreted protein n=1 Tax=Actinidia rufa TaxID=165716 RepID=A0A7J0GJZ0_9ERIC|nr:hypothetical protein Acr_22g0005250 [Actinidia rufa]
MLLSVAAPRCWILQRCLLPLQPIVALATNCCPCSACSPCSELQPLLLATAAACRVPMGCCSRTLAMPVGCCSCACGLLQAAPCRGCVVQPTLAVIVAAF